MKKLRKYDILSLKSANTELNSVFYEIDKLAIGVKGMAVSYKKLWKILIDRDMKKNTAVATMIVPIVMIINSFSACLILMVTPPINLYVFNA